MPFTNYSDLTTSVSNWLQNDALAALTADFITLFEAWAARRIQIREEETTATLTTVNGSVAVPADYLAWRALTWVNQPDIDLKYRTPSGLSLLYPSAVAGIPTSFTIRAGNILIRSVDDTANAYTFDYYARNAALSTALNSIYTKHPDAYLAGTLAEAYAADRNMESFMFWSQRRDAIFDDIEKLDARTRQLGGIVVRGPTP